MVDWSIAAQVQPPQIQGPAQWQQQAGAGANNMVAAAQQIRQFQSQNALRGILSQPDAIGADGQPSQNAMKQIYAIDPNIGAALQQNALKTQGMKSELWQQKHDMLATGLTPVAEQYEDDIKKGLPPNVAAQNAQKTYSDALKSFADSGNFTPDEIKAMPTNFDYARVSGGLQTYQQRRQQQIEQQRATTAEKHMEIQEKQNQDRIDIVRQAAGAKDYDKPQEIQVDGKPILAQQDKRTGQWVTADEKRTPVSSDDIRRSADVRAGASAAAERAAIVDDIKKKTPGISDADAWKTADRDIKVAQGTVGDPAERANLAKGIASYQIAPLSGFALARPEGQAIMAEVTKFNPDYQESRYPEVSKAMSSFGTGKQGDTIRSLNVATQHLETMDEAAKALKNGDLKAFNAIANRVAEETGNPAPTTFDGLKQIVGTEIEKAVAGGIGASADREALMKSLQGANSPDQLLQMTQGFRRLMAGQAMGLKKQYEDATGFKTGPFAFDNKLMPATAKVLGDISGGESDKSKANASSIPVLKSKDEYDKLPSGAKYRREGDPADKYRIKP